MTDNDGGVDDDEAAAPDLAEEALAELQRRNVVRNALERLDEGSRGLLTRLFAGGEAPPASDGAAGAPGSVPTGVGPSLSGCLAQLRRQLGPLPA